MKKALLLFVLLFFFLPEISAQTVYITKTGAKYHSGGCSYLRKSSIPIDLKDAIAQGYTPCSRCSPPTLQEQTNPKDSTSYKSSNKSLIKENSSTPTETYNGHTIYTGPRGGKYYLNKNGKKTYIRKNK